MMTWESNPGKRMKKGNKVTLNILKHLELVVGDVIVGNKVGDGGSNFNLWTVDSIKRREKSSIDRFDNIICVCSISGVWFLF